VGIAPDVTPSAYGERVEKPMTTPKSELVRIAQAAATHSWDVTAIPSAVMATRESGRLGEPWVVMAATTARGLRVSFFHPGDALDAQGEELSDLSGNPREIGRQLRTILEDLAEGAAA
jgi:hypothetical protein